MAKKGNTAALKEINSIASKIQKEGGYTEKTVKTPKVKRSTALKQAGKIYKSKKK